MEKCTNKYLLTIALSLFLLALMFATSHAQPYIVINKLAIITENPRLKYELSGEDVEINDGIEDFAIFGNIIDAVPVRGRRYNKWLLVKSKDVDIGYIEKKAVARVPTHIKMKPEKFVINQNNLQLYIIPGKRAYSKKHSGLRLPYGMTVTGVGSYMRNGVSWTLLRFHGNEKMNIGMGDRYGWVKTFHLRRSF